ncbi:MAG: cell division protein FtsL [Acetatifactor sp.]|nr:cell division protein FtsL [Acetatifactor sp.]
MNQRVNNRQNVSRHTGRTPYVDGSAARKYNEVPVRRNYENEDEKPVVRINREKERHMSAGYVLFLVAALCLCSYILFNYIQLQAELTNVTRTVAKKESQLNNMKIANDENYNRIASSMDLEKIKSIAIGELGMVYAAEGQIVLYSSEGNDCMRQVTQNN